MPDLTVQELSDVEFKAFVESVKNAIETFNKELFTWKDMFARMSRPQLRDARQQLRGVLRADHVNRLALWGRGIIAPHFAIPEKGISASTLKALPSSALKVLNNPDSILPLVTRRGVVHKQVDKLNQIELYQIIDPITGIRDEDEQAKHMLRNVTPKVDRKKNKDVEFVESICAATEPGVLVLKAGNVMLKVRLKDLKHWIK